VRIGIIKKTDAIYLVTCLLLVSIVGILLFLSSPVMASTTTDLQVKINSMLELKLSSCNSSNNSMVEVNLQPSTSGTFKSNCQTVSVNTNAPGYSLSVKASGSNASHNSGANTNSMLYRNPTTISPFPTIPSTTNTITSPAVLANNTWGFAVEQNYTDASSSLASNFDSSYTIDNASNKYASLPTTDTTIYSTDNFPLVDTDHDFFYATKLTPDTMAGSYATTVTYTATGEAVPEIYLSHLVSVKGITKMQELTSSTCSATSYDASNGGINSNNTVTLIDSRDNKTYRVRKMPDNKCWMIDNLALADYTLTSADSDVAVGEDFTIPTNPTQSGSIGIETPAYSNPDITNTLGYGFLYNWYTATAGTGNASINQDENAPSSICPAGWRLPTSGWRGTSELEALQNAMGGYTGWLPNGLFAGVFAGYYAGFNGNLNGVGSEGLYWASTYDGGYAGALMLTGTMGLVDSESATVGAAVRCML